MDDLNKLPRNMTSIAEAMTAFMQILGSAKESLKKILLRGEFDEYPDENNMHCTARLAEMLNNYLEELQSKCLEMDSRGDEFLLHEISVLKEAKSIGLPNFLPRTSFLTLLQKKVKGISFIPYEFVDKTWTYIESIVVSVLMKHSDNYPHLLSSTRRAAQNLVAMKKKETENWVLDIVEMEKLSDYTCHPDYVGLWNKLMSHQHAFVEKITDHSKPTDMCIDGYGDIDVSHLRSHAVAVVQEAFDLKMRLSAYLKIVLRRLVDSMALHLLFSVQNLVNREMEMEIINEIIGLEGKGLERMLEESPAVAEKRKRLNGSIKLLKESKDVVAHLIDNIGSMSLG